MASIVTEIMWLATSPSTLSQQDLHLSEVPQDLCDIYEYVPFPMINFYLRLALEHLSCMVQKASINCEEEPLLYYLPLDYNREG